ncbi:Bax inhibitor-1/YccA family protein [Azospirillum soli]|uniref:Bax inhibitor-1/YccA family protein n=1 Tax=Azospirillum soli TaxID=1304799 RepID=UPI001AE73540|nr:Bax inhibitor-1/YccA family protein [Azospirillum soli]MBP2310922.1 FtsH-binding integral membrane protein [Azospirillum soli]
MFNQYPNQNQWGTAAPTVDRAVFDEGLRKHMLRVYNFMMLGLGLTGLVAFFVASTPALYVPIFTTPLKWVVMLAPLAFVMVLSWRFERMSASGLQGLFWAFCAVMGVSMASILLVFTGASVARVFFITAAMFAAMSLYGYTTKADLSKMGSFLMMGLIGIVIAGLVNIFVGSSALQFAISVIGVVIFTGLTAYDTQRIKEEYAEHYGHETNTKLAVMGALSLYLNFINLFQMLMQLMGQRDE